MVLDGVSRGFKDIEELILIVLVEEDICSEFIGFQEMMNIGSRMISTSMTVTILFLDRNGKEKIIKK